MGDLTLEQRVHILERRVEILRKHYHDHEEWLDTVNSPLYKRVWWWMQGYKFYTVGRWYGKD